MFEQLNKEVLLERVKDAFDDSVAYDSTWQTNAMEAFGFRDGHAQWTKFEKDILSEEGRPALTLNVVKAHIDLIKGLNEDIRKKYVATPISIEDGFLCEVLNNVIYWLYQRYDFDSEEENAYESSLISGRGWLALDYNLNEENMNEIKISLTSVPVHEVRRDPASRKKDLSDASYIFWDRWLSLEDFAVKYPKFEQKAREAFDTGAWPDYPLLEGLTPEATLLSHDINDESDYSDPLDLNYFDSKKKQIRVCHMEYWKYVKTYHVYDPETGALQKINAPWKVFKKQWAKVWPNRKLRYETTTTKEIWWLQFCGEDILVHMKSPLEFPGFSLVPCFMFDDVSRRNGHHYGIVELMKDPQREINKRTSQTLNLFNQQVQPGVYAEARAFVNVDQAEQSLKESGSVTWLQDGAIGQQRFTERKVPTFPNAVLQMGEYAREMLKHITGINPDLLGMNDKRQEAGIVVQLRQQQGMAILKPVFKSYSMMRRELFKRLVSIVMTAMPTKQIIKILGENGRYTSDGQGLITDKVTGLTCNVRDVKHSQYDIDAEPESASLTQDALELSTFMEMMKNGVPVDPKILISKTNIPISEKVAWAQYVEGMQKSQSEAAQHEMQMKMEETKMKYEVEMKKLELEMAIARRKADDQREKDMIKASVDQEKLNLQKVRDDQSAQIKAVQVMAQAQLGAQKEKREFQDMMINADIAKKRLILDVVEVMAQSQNAQSAEGVKAAVEMYKAALTQEGLDKDRELEMAKAVTDAFITMDGVEKQDTRDYVKMALDAKANENADRAKLKDGALRAEVDVLKTSMQEKSKITAEKIKAEAAVKSAEKNAEAQKVMAKESAKVAKSSANQAKKEKPL